VLRQQAAVAHILPLRELACKARGYCPTLLLHSLVKAFQILISRHFSKFMLIGANHNWAIVRKKHFSFILTIFLLTTIIQDSFYIILVLMSGKQCQDSVNNE